MRKVKIGSKKKRIDYEYNEYCFAIIKYKRKYYIIKNGNEYSFIGDKIRDYEGRKECIERIISEKTSIKLKGYEEYVTIDEYNDIEINKGLENFVTFYLIYVDDEFSYNSLNNEELILVNASELQEFIKISYQKEAIKILLATFMFN